MEQKCNNARQYGNATNQTFQQMTVLEVHNQAFNNWQPQKFKTMFATTDTTRWSTFSTSESNNGSNKVFYK